MSVIIEIVEVLLKLRYFCPLACLFYITYLLRTLTARYPAVNAWSQQGWAEADRRVLLVHIFGIAATAFTLYLAWRERSRLSAATYILRHSAAEIDSVPTRLTEADVQKRIIEFSKDAVGIRVYAGGGRFLNKPNPQHAELKRLGSDCAILLDEGHSVTKESLMELVHSQVRVRLYPREEANAHLRGGLKESSSGQSACLFDKGVVGYKLLQVDNSTLVKMLYKQYDGTFSRGRNPVIRHIIFDLGGVYFEGDFGRFLDKINPILGTHLRVTTGHYGCVDEELNLGTKTISDWVAEKIGRNLSAPEQEQVQSLWENNWTLNTDMQKIASALRQRGYKISLSSNCDTGNADRYEQKGWFWGVDQLFLSCKLRLLKPQPEYFRTMLNRLGADPAACVLIDDHRENVEAAQRLGLSAILVDRTQSADSKAKQVIGELASLSVPVLMTGGPQ